MEIDSVNGFSAPTRFYMEGVKGRLCAENHDDNDGNKVIPGGYLGSEQSLTLGIPRAWRAWRRVSTVW